MKILVVDNHTEHLAELLDCLKGHDVEVQKYHPALKFMDADKGLVILSGGGGEGREANDFFSPGHLWYQSEIDFIKTTKTPIIGICMGFELIAQAYGSKVEKLPRLVKGWRKIAAGSKKLKQFESHRYAVKSVSPDFDVLAKSASGTEMIRHKSRPILATQFHPEIKGGIINLQKLISSVG